MSPPSEAERRHILSQAARELITLVQRCPEILRVIPIDDEDMQTLRELACDEEEESDYAPE